MRTYQCPSRVASLHWFSHNPSTVLSGQTDTAIAHKGLEYIAKPSHKFGKKCSIVTGDQASYDAECVLHNDANEDNDISLCWHEVDRR